MPANSKYSYRQENNPARFERALKNMEQGMVPQLGPHENSLEGKIEGTFNDYRYRKAHEDYSRINTGVDANKFPWVTGQLPPRQTSDFQPRSSLLPQSPGQVVPSQPSMQRPVSAPPLGTPASQVAGLSSLGQSRVQPSVLSQLYPNSGYGMTLPSSMTGKQRSRFFAPKQRMSYQGSPLQAAVGGAAGALAPAANALRSVFRTIGDPAIPGSGAGMDPGVPVSPSYQQGSSRLTENVKPQSIMDDLGSLRIPYSTAGRRESTNVEDRRPRTMFEGMSSGIDQRMRNTPGMYLPGGVQGPLPNVGRGVNDAGRIAAVGDMFDLANIPIPERAVGPLRDARYARGASDLTNDILARRAAGMGVGRPPTEQESADYNAAVQERLANPEPGSLGDFTRGEYGRTEAGREARREAMDQSYLSKPMQGGGMPMADREARLSMLSPPGQQSPSQAVGDRRTQSRSVADATIREELMRQGKYTQEDLDSIAELRGDPDIAMGGRRAVSLLAPGTSIRTPEGGFVMRGPDRETTPEDLERRAAGRRRDIQAPMERMDRVRAARQAMMANRAAAEREMFNMQTNPLANPMLVAGNPRAMEAVLQGRNEMEKFGREEPLRKAQIARYEAETNDFNREGSPEELERKARLDELEIEKRRLEVEAGEKLLKGDPSGDAFGRYLELTPEEKQGPVGRELIRRWREGSAATSGETAGGPNAATGSMTTEDAQANATSLASPISFIIGEDPTGIADYQTLVEKVNDVLERGGTIAPADMESINQYVRDRSMYDPEFASGKGPSPFLSMWKNPPASFVQQPPEWMRRANPLMPPSQ